MNRFIQILLLAFALLVFMPITHTFAYDPLGVDCSGPQANSTICKDRSKTSDPIAGPGGLLINITHIIAFAAGAAAVIVIIVAGMKYITSEGDPGKVTSAKNTVINAVIGLIVIVLGHTLIVFVVNKIYGS